MRNWYARLVATSRLRICAILLVGLISGQATGQPYFLNLLTAELALSRGQGQYATQLYRQAALQSNAFNVLDRALFIALEQQQFEIALEIAKHWVEVHPEHVPALFYLAHLSLRLHDYPLAAKTLDRILSYDPDAALDRILEGIYPDSAQDRNALLAALQQLDSRNNPSLLVMSAGLLSDNNQLNEALAKVNIALHKRPQVTAFITLKANILIKQQQYQAAQNFLQQQVRRQPQNKSLGIFYVRYLLGQRLQRDALAQLDKMTQQWPHDGEIVLLAALVSIDQQRPLDAEKYLLQLLTQEAYIDQAYYYLGINAERLNRPEVAEVYFKKVQQDDLYQQAQQKLALLRVAYGRLQDALAALTQERVDHPEQASFLYLLQVQLLNQNQQRELARQLLDEAIDSLPNQAELLYSRVLLLAPEELAQAERDLTQLLSLEPDNPTYLNAYAYALANQNRNLEKAQRLASRADQLAPNQSAILDTLGLIALQQNRMADAIALLTRAYQIDFKLNIGLRLAQALQRSQLEPEYQQLLQELRQRYPNEPRLTANPLLPSQSALPLWPAHMAHPQSMANNIH
ncbi:MAG: tetratricopeptide repeat protein [Moraxellaceae bacterium]